MAVGEGEIRGRRQLLELLAVPRPLTRFCLWVLAAALAAAAWQWLPSKLIAYFSGVLAPFCLLCASAVWSMRDKLDEAVDGEHMDAATYRNTVAHANKERRRFMRRAAWTAICALVAGSAALSWQVVGAMWHWMVLAGGIAIAEAAYSYLLANSWEEQVRAFRARKILSSKHVAEKQALLDRIEQSRSDETTSGGWTHLPGDSWKHH